MPTAPTSEIGATNQTPTLTVPGWGRFGGSVVDEAEETPALKWPQSVRVTYEQMRNDSQIEALFYATTLPIRRYRWMIDPNGARDEAVEKLSGDLRLPIKGQDAGPIPRARNSFSFERHLHLVLQALLFGHYFFEQVGVVEEDGLWHLRKLAPRAPRTISEFNVEADGGLKSIRQTIGKPGQPMPQEIPVNRLVFYVWDEEPGRFIGRSMLRSIYREWLLKDRLLRVDALKHERNGMGVPVTETTVPDGVSARQEQAAQQIMAAWRAGEHSSATFPYGIKPRLLGVEGTLPDTLASIQRHDEAMSRRWLGMLIQLGQTQTGSRAVGDNFSDLIEMGREAIAGWVVDVFSEHVLADDMVWNYGEGEEFAPRLTYERDDAQVAEPAGPIGAVPTPPTPIAARTGPRRAKLYRQARAQLAAATEFRRERTDIEVRAATNFEAMDAEYRDELDTLLGDWEDVTQAQIDELASQVQGSASLTDLAVVAAAPVGAAVLSAAMKRVARSAASQARTEVKAQGVDVDPPDLDGVDEVLDQRAAATDTLLARSISEAAGREAVRLAGGALDNTAIANGVRTHLEGLSTAYLEQRLGGSVSSAQHYGRTQVFREVGNQLAYYASELLDQNTCDNCAAADGRSYEALDDALAEYPTGGLDTCLGGERCRGTIVAVGPEA